MQKPKKKTIAWLLGVGGAGLLGYVQGVGVEKVMIEQVIEGIRQGDVTKVVAYILIFAVIWLEVRGLKKEVGKLNQTIAKSFAEGEDRFLKLEHRLTLLEEHEKQHFPGGINERTIFV